MFALWYLSFAIDEIRKRLGYPSLFGRQTNDTKIIEKSEPIKSDVKPVVKPEVKPEIKPEVKPEIKPEAVKPKEPEKKPQEKSEPPKRAEVEKKPEPPKITPKIPEGTKSNGGTSAPGKQPESPETQELMKTYEIPDKEDTKKKPDPFNGAAAARQVSPAKPKEASSRTPTPQTGSKSPSPQKNGSLAGKAKSPKDATMAFLAEESSTTKSPTTTKRYPKTVKRP